MPTESESQADFYYELLKQQENYPLEENIITYEEDELRTLEDVQNDKLEELMAGDE